MNILVTGSSGFIGKNLVVRLNEIDEEYVIYKFDKDNTLKDLAEYIKNADIIFHLAGINRPTEIEEFYKGNVDLTKTITDLVSNTKRNIPIIVSSSIQAGNDNDYGKSKKLAEDCLIDYSDKTQNIIKIYRLHNVFGKWSNPNYNSVVSTFCHNIARDLEIQINDENYELELIYIDDIIDSFIKDLSGISSNNKISYINPVMKITLGELSKTIYNFKEYISGTYVPKTGNKLVNNLYSTFLSYLPIESMVSDLTQHKDGRGKYTELIRTLEYGQFSVSHSNPGVVRGKHYHHSKNERFIVASGEALIKIRKIDTSEIYEFKVSGDSIQTVNIVPGYTHSIENIGNTEMVLLIWTNDLFDPENPDTVFMEV